VPDASAMSEIIETKLTPENVPLILEREHQVSKAAVEQAKTKKSCEQPEKGENS
jgi:hypothetical protein